jgi:translocation and assembly module TamA
MTEPRFLRRLSMRSRVCVLVTFAAIPLLAIPGPARPSEPKRQAEIEIVGLGDTILRRVRASLASRTIDCERPYWEVNAEIRRWSLAIRRELRVEGHYSPRFQPEVQKRAGCWHATVEVTPGPGATLRDVDVVITGDARERFLRIIDEADMRPGKVFREPRFVALKQALGNEALEYGFFDARFDTSVVDVYAEEGMVDVRMVFDPGPRYRFGEIRLNAAEAPIEEQLFRRKITVQAGEPYSSERLQDLRRELLASGYLRSARAELTPDARAGHRVHVDVELAFVKRHEISTGVGYATDVGPRFTLSYHNRYLNRSGHQLSENFTISPGISEISQSYRLPLETRHEQWLDITTGLSREVTDTTDTQTISAGVRRLVTFPSRRRRIDSLEFSRDDFEIGSRNDTSIFVTPGVRWVFGELRGTVLPVGRRVSLRLRAAGKALLSESDLIQGEISASWSRLLGEKSRLVLRGQVGATAVEGFSSAPPSLRFFAGGDASVRGYDKRRIGPTNANGEVIGGRQLLTVNLDVERLFKPRWSWAAFFDAGDAFDNLNVNMKKGVGLGIRWHSPAGAVRLDVAHPLDDPNRDIRLHVGIGAAL